MKSRPLLYALTLLGFCFLPGRVPGDPLDQWAWRNPMPTGSPLSAIAYGNNQFVVVGTGEGETPANNRYGVIWTSPDGLTWTSRTSGIDFVLNNIAYGNKQFVAVGAGGTILTSSDGLTWTSRPSGTGNSLHGVAYGNNTFVVVGDQGSILQSAVVVSLPPVLGPVVLLPGGAARVTLTGLAGQTYLIQVSTDLTQWLPLFNVALTTPSGQFLDNSAANFPRRFYRAVAP